MARPSKNVNPRGLLHPDWWFWRFGEVEKVRQLPVQSSRFCHGLSSCSQKRIEKGIRWILEMVKPGVFYTWQHSTLYKLGAQNQPTSLERTIYANLFLILWGWDWNSSWCLIQGWQYFRRRLRQPSHRTTAFRITERGRDHRGGEAAVRVCLLPGCQPWAFRVFFCSLIGGPTDDPKFGDNTLWLSSTLRLPWDVCCF